MDDLIAFLRARLDERERKARAAYGGSWLDSADGWVMNEDMHLCEADGPNAAFIADNDPKFVLVEVDAKRRMLDFAIELWKTEPSSHPHARVNRQATWIMRLLALPYAQHSDYCEEWKVS